MTEILMPGTPAKRSATEVLAPRPGDSPRAAARRMPDALGQTQLDTSSQTNQSAAVRTDLGASRDMPPETAPKRSPLVFLPLVALVGLVGSGAFYMLKGSKDVGAKPTTSSTVAAASLALPPPSTTPATSTAVAAPSPCASGSSSPSATASAAALPSAAPRVIPHRPNNVLNTGLHE